DSPAGLPLRVKFGVKTGQGLSGYTYQELSAIWAKSEELGFDSAWLHDHLFSSTNRTTDPTLEAYTTLGALARDTKRIRLGVMVTCVTFRNPAYLAKVSATVDVISGGRFIMGIGTGWWEGEATSYGLRFPPVSERLGQLRETLKILRLMWTEDSPSFKGEHFSITNAQCYPKPVQRNLPIWIGINSGTRTLPKMAVELGDGFNSTAAPEVCRKMVDRAEETRVRSGRGREEVAYSAQPELLIGNDSEVEEVLKHEGERFGLTPQECLKKLKEEGCIIGTPELCAQELRAYLDAGIEYLIPRIIGDTLLWPLETVSDKLLPLL
ncbi:MAG: LLM class flavin-dependent oxidoreductase, partial [Thaumarchaeota archaeon]|nr:LLM class flavin-dependent oxidoreductase [Nitrososphaerota archaeon]